MKQVTIKRPLESFNNNCPYAIVISGNKIVEIRNGETKVIEVSDDAMVISERFDVNIEKGENTIEISGNKFFNKWLPFSGSLLVILGMTFTINHDITWLKTLGILLMVLYVLFLIGVLTIWKNKWLTIKKKS